MLKLKSVCVILAMLFFMSIAHGANTGLTNDGRISGRLVSASSGVPIDGDSWPIWVRLSICSDRYCEDARSYGSPARTDQEGRFSFSGLPAGWFRLTGELFVSSEIRVFEDADSEPFRLDSSESFDYGDLALPRLKLIGSIKGRIVDSTHGQVRNDRWPYGYVSLGCVDASCKGVGTDSLDDFSPIKLRDYRNISVRNLAYDQDHDDYMYLRPGRYQITISEFEWYERQSPFVFEYERVSLERDIRENEDLDLGDIKVRRRWFPLASLGDVNGDGEPDAAAIISRNGNTSAPIRGLKPGSSEIGNLDFNDTDQPNLGLSTIAQLTVQDANGNNARELLTLSYGYYKRDLSGYGWRREVIQVRDTASGDLLQRLYVDGEFETLMLANLPIDGSQAVALLGQKDDAIRAEIRELWTGTILSRVWFTSANRFIPRDLEVIPDLNGNGAPELALLSENAGTGKRAKVEIRDSLTATILHNIWWASTDAPYQLATLNDLNGNGSMELAVMSTASPKVVVKDSATGRWVTQVTFDQRYAPFRLAVVPDITGNGADELALLAVRHSDGRIRAQVKDPFSRAGETISTSGFGTREMLLYDFVVVPDVNGNGSPDLARLGRWSDDRRLLLGVKDSRTGELISETRYSAD